MKKTWFCNNTKSCFFEDKQCKTKCQYIDHESCKIYDHSILDTINELNKCIMSDCYLRPNTKKKKMWNKKNKLSNFLDTCRLEKINEDIFKCVDYRKYADKITKITNNQNCYNDIVNISEENLTANNIQK